MIKPKYVYHGSAIELEGDALVPKKAKDLGDKSENLLIGIYATDIREEALAIGILKCKGVRASGSGVDESREIERRAVIYAGWPQQEHFFLYTLPSESFDNLPKGSKQFVSLTPVIPARVEKLAVTDFIHLVRKATDKEVRRFYEKYGEKIKRRSNRTF